ncbi:hypothetical protein [Agrococcus sediminis]|uniref:hypothetical protein n=1 Tax=Agrococcus sediminis TaxID=2599924 RepID=UPI0034393255
MAKTRQSTSPNQSQWTDFLLWNEWITDAFYVGQAPDPAPVYLDFDGEPAKRLTKLAGHRSPEETAQALVKVVRDTVPAFGKKVLFKDHERRVRSWARATRAARRSDPSSLVDAPPVLPLLLCFALAAEQMGADGLMAPSNYYGRLSQVLQRDVEDLRHSYQASAELLWGSLNAWLVEEEGRRGLPSAYSISAHRYVGIAVSQALVREADRSHLPDFFEFAGLAPHSDVPPEALEPLLLAWTAAAHNGATAQLSRLIENDGTRSRVAEIASVELAAWQGSEVVERSKSKPQLHRPVVLRLQFSGMPLRKPRFTPVLRLRSDEPRLPASLVAAGGDQIQLELERLGAGTYAPPRASVPDAGDLLQSRLRFLVDGVTVERAPTPAVVFRADEFGVEFWETHSVVRGERLHVLVRSEFSAQLKSVLEEVAPPTWRGRDYPGLPADWSLFEDVEIVRAPSATLDGRTRWLADLLTPITSHHLSLHDGFRMPGSIRQRWLADAPPTVTASSDSPDGFQVTIDRIPEFLDSIDGAGGSTDRHNEYAAEGSPSEPLLIALADLDLRPGTYEVILSSASKSSPSRQRRQFTLVAPAPRRADDVVVGLDLSAALTPIERTTVPTDKLLSAETDGLLVGAAHFGMPTDGATAHPTPTSRAWPRARPRMRATPPRLEAAVSGSCFFTSIHNWDVETVTFVNNRPTAKWTPATCKMCGMTRLYPTRLPRKAVGSDDRAARPDYPAIDAPRRRDTDHDERLALAIAALAVAGAGDGASLQRILAQVDSSALTVHRIVQDLAAVGALALARHPASGAVISWSLVPATVVTTTSGATLTSYWGEEAIAFLENAVEGEDVTFRAEVDGLTSTLIATNAEDGALWSAVEELDHGAFHAGEASQAIAASLTPLSEVLGAIPRVSMPHGGTFERFDPRAATWTPIPTPSVPGAYRNGTYAREYFIRMEDDIVAGDRALVDAATAKHAAALLDGAPPLLYRDPRRGDLRTPLGCPLPGLYGRAAALSAVRIPYDVKDEIVYDAVEQDVADRLTYLLAH